MQPYKTINNVIYAWAVIITARLVSERRLCFHRHLPVQLLEGVYPPGGGGRLTTYPPPRPGTYPPLPRKKTPTPPPQTRHLPPTPRPGTYAPYAPSMCGRYASYWNALLFYYCLVELPMWFTGCFCMLFWNVRFQLCVVGSLNMCNMQNMWNITYKDFSYVQ